MRRLAALFLVMLTVSACVDRSFTPTVPKALDIGTPYTVFAATTRAREADGTYGFDRSARMDRLELTVSIPPNHTPGEIRFAYANPKPETQFTIAGRADFPDAASFQARLRQELKSAPSGKREVTVFVHGYNATQAETAMRAAQLANDIDMPGALVIYSWPSRARVTGYAYDADSMMFARDGLETLLREIKATGVDNILLVAHSMGSMLSMETMRQADLREPGWPARAIAAVLLISPDLDVEVFRSQMLGMSAVPEPFIVMSSEKDRALNLSARLRGTADRQRLGNIRNLELVEDLPIEIVDTTAFSKDAQSSHFVPATSPALIAMFNDARSTIDVFGSEKLAIEQILPTQAEVVQSEEATEIRLLPAEENPV